MVFETVLRWFCVALEEPCANTLRFPSGMEPGLRFHVYACQFFQFICIESILNSANSLLFLIANIVTTRKALVTRSDALVTSSEHCYY